MIIAIILTAITDIVSGLLGSLPTATLATIPYIGDDIQSILITMIQTWNAVLETIPYLQIVWNLALWAIAFELMLIGIKFIFGSRTPIATN